VRRWILLLAVAVLATFSWRLGASPLVKTEGLRAITANEMVTSGKWVVPRLYGQPYLAKPPLHYWALALTRQAIGDTHEWVWRVPSVLAHAALVVLVGLVSHRWFGEPAGLIAGGATIGLFALWSQALKADIDAGNTLACVAATFGMLEMGCRRRSGAAMVIGTGLAVGAMLLLKGPAGLPPVIGAIGGAAIGGRTWAPLRRPAAWLALGIGAIIFGAWALAAYRVLGGGLASGAPNGVDELLRQLGRSDVSHVLDALAVPFTLLLYALPITVAIPFALSKATLADVDPEGSVRIRALVWTIIVALAIGVLARTHNPRYAYVVLPLVAPLAGVVGQAWLRGAYGRIGHHVIGLSIVIGTVGLVGMSVAFAILASRHGTALDVAAAAGAASSIVAGIATFVLLHRQRRGATAPLEAAAMLRDAVGPGERVIVGDWVMTAPQLFHYAGVEVDYRPGRLGKVHQLPEDRWILFQEHEWRRWRKSMGERFDPVIPLPVRNHRPVLARVGAASDAPARPSKEKARKRERRERKERDRHPSPLG
jgi:4-amino-4-deoxy-L-arabinose transferase-like glycosyltransferase